jgi:hypothetical protein
METGEKGSLLSGGVAEEDGLAGVFLGTVAACCDGRPTPTPPGRAAGLVGKAASAGGVDGGAGTEDIVGGGGVDVFGRGSGGGVVDVEHAVRASVAAARPLQVFHGVILPSYRRQDDRVGTSKAVHSSV